MGEPATESDTLLPRDTEQARARSSQSMITGRFKVILFLVILVFAGIAYQIEVNQLQTLLQEEHDKVEQLETVLQQHSEVINRFNSSVTNNDVMDRLTALENDLATSKKQMRQELQAVQQDVSAKLSETLESLNDTVRRAEDLISSEVDRVKKDVDQYVIATQDQFSMQNSFMVYQLAGTFMLLSCLISMWHMTAHVRRMNQPDVQRKILAILWMVPIYAITSWFSLVFDSAEGYLAIIKDGYEAYVIYQFLSFCIAVLGKGDRNVVIDLLSKRADHLTPPFRLVGFLEICGLIKPQEFESDRALASAVLLQCQAFALQFVFFRPLTTTAMVVLKKVDYYGNGDGPTDYRSPQFYITIIQNLSIFTAFTGLLKFYHAVDKDLAWCRPFAKFLCIKCVVFMTFWQGLVIAVLASTTNVGGQDADQWAQSAQNFLICLEMLLFSIAHFYCFPTDEWEDGYRVKQTEGKFGDSIALRDFFSDIKLILRSNEPTRTKKRKKKAGTPAIPEGNEDEESVRTETASLDGSETTSMTASEGNGEHAFQTPEKHSIQSEQDRLSMALEECLGLAADDPDIAEAKQRLLKSNILSPDMFSGPENADEEDLDRTIGAYLRENGSHPEVTTEMEGDEETAGQYDPQGGVYSNVKYSNDVDKLMDFWSSPDYQLRPSFFTTVASMAASESEDEESPKNDGLDHSSKRSSNRSTPSTTNDTPTGPKHSSDNTLLETNEDNESKHYSGPFYSADELRKEKISGLDYKNREQYISPDDFEIIFETSKADFYELPKWKQIKMKQEKKLF